MDTKRQSAPRLAPWTDQLLCELGLDGRSERSTGLFRTHWHTLLVSRGARRRLIADLSVESCTIGPIATRRTVRLRTSEHDIRLELGRGLELGVGMPKWLRSATGFINEERIGVLAIRPGEVTIAQSPDAKPVGAWHFDGKLLGYIGLQDPVVYGAVTSADQPIGELMAPRLHTYHQGLVRGGTPLWRSIVSDIDEPARRWMLALTALALFCIAVGYEWHDHRPGRGND